MAEDEVPLRELIEATFAQIDHRYEQRFLAQERALDAAMKAVERQRIEVNERYTQRFDAQERAVQLALDRVDKEFHEHLQQVRDENRLALAASEKAIIKAEAATERRFESVNEFRAQLNDQSSTFMPRAEAEQRIAQNTEKVEALTARLRDADYLSRTEYQSRHDDLVKQVQELQRQLSGISVESAANQRSSSVSMMSSQNRQRLTMGWVVGGVGLFLSLISVIVAVAVILAR